MKKKQKVDHRFSVNSLGEVWKPAQGYDHKFSILEAVDPHMKHRLWFDKYRMGHPPTVAKVNEVIDDLSRHGFSCLCRDNIDFDISYNQYIAWLHVSGLQKKLQNSRFRLHAVGGKTWYKILLVTEFAFPSSDSEARREMRKMAKRLGCKLELMGEFNPGLHRPEPEEQWEMNYTFPAKTSYEEIRDKKKLIAKVSQKLWKAHGVSVA